MIQLGLVLSVAFAVVGCTQIFNAAPCVTNCGPGGDMPNPPASKWITQEEIKGNAKWDARYTRFFSERKEGAVIPALRQGFIPQAIGYSGDLDWFLMSGYRDSQTSLVTIVDASSEKHIKTLQFTKPNGTDYREHAGGLAITDEHLWLSSNEHVYYIELGKVVAAKDGDKLRFTGQSRVDAQGSFVSVSDDVLWVGDFAYAAGGYTPKDHHKLINRVGGQHTGWIAGYKLDSMTGLIPSNTPKNSIGAYIPDYILSIPDKIQEVTVYDNTIILTESYGRNNVSNLFVYENPMNGPKHTEVKIGGISVPVWFLDNRNRNDTWLMPPMAEGITERNGETFIIFESAALKYLDGSYALSRLQIIESSRLR